VRAEDPAVPVQRLLAEIRKQGYTGSISLLYRYITRDGVEADRPHLSPKTVTWLLLTRPDALNDSQPSRLRKLTAAPGYDQPRRPRLLRPKRVNEARLKN
jgi:hypothetical protein